MFLGLYVQKSSSLFPVQGGISAISKHSTVPEWVNKKMTTG